MEIPVEEFRLERKYWPVVPSGAINATERVIAEYLINGRITGVSRNCNAIWEMKIVINNYWWGTEADLIIKPFPAGDLLAERPKG